MLVDTHAHLFYPNFENDLDQVIERAKNSGVDYMIVPGTDLATSLQAIELAEKYDNIYASVGVHPHDSKDWNDSSRVYILIKKGNSLKVVPISPREDR